MRKRFAPIFLTAGLLLFVGAGCLDSDVDLLVGFVGSWLQQRGVLDANGKPTTGTIKYVASGGWISSGDKDNDALIDGGLVAKSVKEADEAVETAHSSARKGNYDEADATLNRQIAKRPHDHHVRHAKGAILMQRGRGGEAKEYFASTAECNPSTGNLKPSDYNRCKSVLRDEEEQLSEATPGYAGSAKDATYDSPGCDLVRQRIVTLVRLEDIARLQGRFDEGDDYRQQRINLEGRSPACKQQ